MEKRGQISVEYIMIIVIAMLIILPGVFLFRNYIFESSDRILESRLNEIANQVLGKARKMHYYGPPSKTTVNVDMPPQINNMYVQRHEDEYYLVFEILTNGGVEKLDYQSEIPIRPGELAPACDVSCPSTSICECFPERYFSKGIKNLQSESASSSTCTGVSAGAAFCVVISEISPDLP